MLNNYNVVCFFFHFHYTNGKTAQPRHTHCWETLIYINAC